MPVALVGAARQHGYGNVRPRVALIVGLLAIGGTVAGVALANALRRPLLKLAFAGLMLFVAARMARNGLRRPQPEPDPPAPCRTRSDAP